MVNLCVPDRVITYGVMKLGEHIPDGVRSLRTSNVRPLRIEIEGMKIIAPDLSEDYSRTILRGGEVLVNVRGTLGGVAPVPPEMAGWNISREVAMVPADASKVDSNYLAYWIATKNSQDWLTGVKKGAAYTGINIEDLRNLPVSHPDKHGQQAIVQKLDALAAETRRLEAVYQRKLDALAELKQSLLLRAFAGEL